MANSESFTGKLGGEKGVLLFRSEIRSSEPETYANQCVGLKSWGKFELHKKLSKTKGKRVWDQHSSSPRGDKTINTCMGTFSNLHG